jgi:hypothetical protein
MTHPVDCTVCGGVHMVSFKAYGVVTDCDVCQAWFVSMLEEHF